MTSLKDDKAEQEATLDVTSILEAEPTNVSDHWEQLAILGKLADTAEEWQKGKNTRSGFQPPSEPQSSSFLLSDKVSVASKVFLLAGLYNQRKEVMTLSCKPEPQPQDPQPTQPQIQERVKPVDSFLFAK